LASLCAVASPPWCTLSADFRGKALPGVRRTCSPLGESLELDRGRAVPSADAEAGWLSRLHGGMAAWLQTISVGLAAQIPLGSGSDRWRLGAICASTALLAGWTYPLFAHWVWGGGWLAQLGSNYGLGRGFVDAGGSSTIQVVGGLTALSIAWILGPRRGKYSAQGMQAAIPAHNTVFVLFGCVLALLGWSGLNPHGALL